MCQKRSPTSVYVPPNRAHPASPEYVESGRNATSYGESGRPSGPAAFEAPATGVRAEFVSDGDGAARLVFTDGRPYPATRLPDEAPLDPEAYAGRYVSGELGALYTVRAVGEGLEITHVRLDEPVPLRRIAGDRFRGGYPLGNVEFERDADGPVSGFVASAGRTRGVRFEKVD